MARYFFHLRNADKSLLDCRGMVLADPDAAHHEAIQTVQDFYQRSTDQVSPEWKGWCVDVCDQRGRSLFRLRFADAPNLKAAQAEGCNDPVPLAEVFHLNIERRQRELQSLENSLQELVRVNRRLVERTQYEVKNLQSLTKSMSQARQRSEELVARSRGQRPAWDWLSLAQELNPYDGGVTLNRA